MSVGAWTAFSTSSFSGHKIDGNISICLVISLVLTNKISSESETSINPYIVV